jgi:hypothetical protein
MVFVVRPLGWLLVKYDPLDGVHSMLTAPGQLSVAEVVQVTFWRSHRFGSVATTYGLAGTVSAGFSPSRTKMVKDFVVELPLLSVPVQVTLVMVPTG